MTKEQIEARKAELRKALQASEEQSERLRGAIQDCDYWLKQLDGEKEQAE
jgi:predicted  nucleic acid-binding Zn-ribbon protein